MQGFAGVDYITMCALAAVQNCVAIQSELGDNVLASLGDVHHVTLYACMVLREC